MNRAEIEALTSEEQEAMYADMLDEIYGEVTVAGYTYNTSRILKEVDPIAFRCGVADYIDSLLEDAEEAEEEEV